MEDTVSHSSVDSAADEFVLVNSEPKLRIPDNGNLQELEKKMIEVMHDDHPLKGTTTKMTDDTQKQHITHADLAADNVAGQADNRITDSESVKVDLESQKNKDEATNGDVSDEIVEADATFFTGVTYLGSASVNAPRSEGEINRNMAVLNDQSQMAIPTTLSVPIHSEGIVYLTDPATGGEIANYPIHQILFCARGPAETPERDCFAFTCGHGDSIESAIFQCHVFRCDLKEAKVGKILYTFATAFRHLPKSPSSDMEADRGENNMHKFDVSLEFKEDDGRGNFSTSPKDKNVFKLRCNLEKKIVITVTQLGTGEELHVERCFGLLIAPGKNSKNNDMHLIDMVSMGVSGDGRSYVISGNWDPTEACFQILNLETPPDTRVFMTIAVDLVIVGIQEPVRFLIETKARIFPQNERFWYFSKKPHHEQFFVQLKECENTTTNGPCQPQYEVASIESQAEIDRRKAGMALTLSPTRIPTQNIQTPQDPDGNDSGNDEPLLSGSGIVSKDVRDEDMLSSWHEALKKWHQNLKQRPRQVGSLCRAGVPEALRGEVWQLLVGCQDNPELQESYRILITKDSPCEQVIARDINRTFPAHDYFKETGGVGQDSLFKISKAYSVYDDEVGYCQGLSFLAAALLLHMPEEQAFCVLVQVMFDYNLRDLFKPGFEDLHLKFYQLERLIQDQLPDLFDHFMELGLEAHMYASQWFLTLFTAKFPLFMVFHILDIFFCDGIDVIFKVSLALLKTSKKDLCASDFEGVLKYFRVSLPKKYRVEEAALEVINQAISSKRFASRTRVELKTSIMPQQIQLTRLEDPGTITGLDYPTSYASQIKAKGYEADMDTDSMSSTSTSDGPMLGNRVPMWYYRLVLTDIEEDLQAMQDTDIEEISTSSRAYSPAQDSCGQSSDADTITSDTNLTDLSRSLSLDLSVSGDFSSDFESGGDLELRPFLPSCTSCGDHDDKDRNCTCGTHEVSQKKLKKYEKEYVMMKEEEMERENPLERYEVENKRLTKSNMRLEQENDDLAHELVTSKIGLRNELDYAEDRCEVLNKELLQTKQHLLDADEEKKRLAEESSQLKEMCRRELERAESESVRNTAIIADYKQITSQLSERLEKQQAANRDELHRIKGRIGSCENCSELVSPDGQFKKLEKPVNPVDLNPYIVEKDRLLRELELELAQTKLALVESECKTQDLTHQLNQAMSEIQTSKNTWLQKTWTSLKDVTAKKEGKKEG